MDDPRDSIPTLMITTADNYLVLVGDPQYISGRKLSGYAKKGYIIKTVPFKEYRIAMENGMKWIYDKPKIETHGYR